MLSSGDAAEFLARTFCDPAGSAACAPWWPSRRCTIQPDSAAHVLTGARVKDDPQVATETARRCRLAPRNLHLNYRNDCVIISRAPISSTQGGYMVHAARASTASAPAPHSTLRFLIASRQILKIKITRSQQTRKHFRIATIPCVSAPHCNIAARATRIATDPDSEIWQTNENIKRNDFLTATTKSAVAQARLPMLRCADRGPRFAERESRLTSHESRFTRHWDWRMMRELLQ